MTHTHTQARAGVAALVHGDPLGTDRVEALLAATPPRDPEAYREGRARAVRQHRRWAAQVVVTDELARRACAELGLRPPEDTAPPDVLAVDEADAAELGSIVAAALAYSPAARALLDRLEALQHLPEATLRDYYLRNPDRFLTPDALRRGADPFGATAPEDLTPYQEVRAGIEKELRQAMGRRAFFLWLDRERSDVVCSPGYEHPGDPGHPDHEHRH
jgi:[acyl-carrier-protein] S-malonyltransferase